MLRRKSIPHRRSVNARTGDVLSAALQAAVKLGIADLPAGGRTGHEFRALFARSGFEMTRIVQTESLLNVIEAVPVR